MSDRTWEHLARHLQRRAEDRAELERRLDELAERYSTPWAEVHRALEDHM